MEVAPIKKITINDVAQQAGVSVTTVSLVLSGKGGISEQAAAQQVPMVCVSRSSGIEGLDVVRPDNMQAAKMATEHLIKQGHSQIAYLGGQGHSMTRAERLGGFCATLVRYGLPFKSEWIVECDDRQLMAGEAAEALLSQHPNISALVCHQGSVALGAYFGLLRSGRTIAARGLSNVYGQQVALIGFGDVPEAELTEPPLSFVSSSAHEVGRSAAERILQRIQATTPEINRPLIL